MTFILQLALIIAASKVAGQISVWLKQPAVLGELLVGVVLGPALLGWVSDTELIHIFSEIGVLLLMFLAGNETQLKVLKDNSRSATAVAAGGILFPLMFGALAGLAAGLTWNTSLFIGIVLSATSVSITVQTLKEMNQLQARESTAILGAAVLDDVLVVILLAFVLSLFGQASQSIWLVMGEKLLFFSTAIMLAWKVIPTILRWAERLQVTQPVVSIAVALGLLFAWYADFLGVAGIIGAFIAGLSIGQSEFRDRIERTVEPIAYSIFVPVFFTGIGLKVSFDGLQAYGVFIVLFTVLAVLTKWFGSAFGARVTGFNWLSSFCIGAGMISRGEVALILAATGSQAKWLTDELYTALILIIILSTLAAPPVLKLMFRHKDKMPVG
ncbi:cation:proton antiporter [Sporolactobacillus spathodeae]|uniref:Monovalent cation:proton antiporter-2 (CPA2) family protein n=1 Tax=Sporolactobacillus spathodeae TaxID=1465502 RepID=A0ABS2Q9I0_9BACL|nr:cation:proton antiporter [Sporolactobacillus spathodeae]MBM7658420.1 monovalent cation:proton antiporter-2 (CPA2) family protein [Sporolactobacillus spathodeae]